MLKVAKSAEARTAWLGWIKLGAACVFVAAAGLAFWSTTVSRFVASELGQNIALATAAIVGLLMALLTFFDPFYAHDTPARAAKLASSPVLANPVIRTLCVSLMTSYFTFEAVSGALLQFWTFAVGHAAEQTLHLGDYHTSTRGSCSGFSLLEAPFKSHRIICARYDAVDVPLPGTPVRVYGVASGLGIDVAEFEIAETGIAPVE